MIKDIEVFFKEPGKWQKSFLQLRSIILECGLNEELKWGKPCFTYDGHNIVLIHGFKDYCALLFHKGSLLKDPDNILIQQTENVQAGRQIRFANEEEITEMKTSITAYIYEAMEVEKAGLQVKLKKTSEYEIPEEFQSAIDNDKNLKDAFYALTPGRQRGYLLHFSNAKQSKTRTDRVNKYIPKIMQGKGLQD